MIALGFSLRRVVGTLVIGVIFAIATHASSAQSSKASKTAGATLFRDKGCGYCHGANTQGTAKGPSLVHVRKILKAPQIANQIKNGGQKMPSFEDSLSSEEINQLVAYLRARHRPTPAPLPAAKPAAVPPDPQTSSPVSNPGQ